MSRKWYENCSNISGMLVSCRKSLQEFLFLPHSPEHPTQGGAPDHLPEVPLPSMFNERKTAHMTAYLLKQAGGKLEYIKIIKMLYLAEREHLNLYHSPMTGDKLCALPHGPIVSTTYNCIKDDAGSCGAQWHEWISGRDGYFISLAKEFEGNDDLEELGEADLEILADIHRRFGGMPWKQLVRYTHNNCQEWKHPGNTSTVIEYDDVLKALGYEPEQRARIETSIKENNYYNSILSSHCS